MSVEIAEQTWLERAVAAFLTTFTFGDVVPPAWLEEHLEIRWPERGTRDQYRRVSLEQFARMDALRGVLLEDHKMALRNARGGQYHVVAPDEQHRHGMEETRAGVDRSLRKGWRIIENTRTDLMSDAAKKARDEAIAKLAAFEALAKRRLRGPLPTAPKLPAPDNDGSE